MERVALTLSGVVKAHGEVAALRGLDIEVLEGEFFVLVGPSGCGKTTLLRAVAGLATCSTAKSP
jgi:ABC-type Fe3+/spermidine/putrescine transport system ATPase subunit